jgi:4-amino-4-deoxy-L-arabinose transferase-like glycosyltransferase
MNSRASVKRVLGFARGKGSIARALLPISLPAGRLLPGREATFVVLTILAIGASFFLMLGRYPLFDVDEGAFSQATLEMFQRGDFLSTTLNGQPRYDKPILTYWLQAASVALLGASEWAFRLPSALCSSIWALLVYLFVKRRFGRRTALLAALVLSTSLLVCVVARVATAEGLLNMLLAAAMLSAWLYLETGRRGWLYATFTAAALGFLTKGPVAVLLPFGVTLVFCLLRRDFRTWLRIAVDPIGLSLFVLISVPWYAATIYRDGWGFAEGFFLRHNLERFAAPMQGHSGNFAYYLPVLLVGTLPFTAWLIRAFLRVRNVWRDDLQLYLLLWFVFTLVFFSFAATKLPHYLVYGLTGLSILMAIHGPSLRSEIWTLAPAFVFLVALLMLPAVLGWIQGGVHDAEMRDLLAAALESLGESYFAYTAGAAVLTFGLMFAPQPEPKVKMALAAAACTVGMTGFLIPTAAKAMQEPVKEAATLARERGYAVVTWGINVPSFSVYYGRPAPSRLPLPGEVVLTKQKRLAELGPHVATLYTRQGVVLARMTP